MEDEEPAAATGGASLPGYSLLPQSSSSDATPAFQFDIVPRSDASSFQAGYQGLQERGFQVWIRGDVLLKAPPQVMTRCSIRLVAEEMAESRSLTLHDASQVLWTSPTQPTTSSAPAYDAQPPSMMPFEFSLPQHLPHCLHLPDVKLEYRLVATLEGADHPQSKTVAVHVTRYSAPGPLKQLLPSSSQQRFSDEPKVWKRTSPTDIDVTLARTLFRRGDHIPLRIQVAAPHDKLIAKGLRIRSVEAELVRTIEARRPQAESSTSNSKARQKDGEGVWEPHEHLLEDTSNDDTTPPPSSSNAAPTRHRTVLAYSGKACRFSLSRPLVLHLTLVPPFTSPALPHPSPDHDAPPAGLSPLTAGSAGGGGGCESITQETALSSVSFAVKVYIRMRGPSASGAAANATATATITAPGSSSAAPSAPTENQDVVLESDVYILPALAGAGGVEAEPEGEASNEAAAPNGVSWPTDEEEFDGYEDFQDSREVFEEEEQAAAAIAASQPRIDVNGDASIVGATAAAAGAVRRPSYHPSSTDEPPPTVQQSQHDLQIFPSGSAGHGGDDDAFPPPHSERQDVNEVPSYDEEQGPTSATMPPAWTARTTEPIDGVGEGERRYPPHHDHRLQAPNGLTTPAQGSYEAPPPLASPPPGFDDASHAQQQQPFALPSEQQTHLHLERSSSMQQGAQEHHRRQRGTSAIEPPPYMTMMAAGHGASSPPPPPSSPPPALTSPSSPPPPPPLSPGAYYSPSHDAHAEGSSTPLATTSRAPATNGNGITHGVAGSSSSYPTAAEEKEALALSMAMADTSVATGPAEEGSSQSGGDPDEFVDAPEGVVGSEEEHGDGVDDELPPGYEA